MLAVSFTRWAYKLLDFPRGCIECISASGSGTLCIDALSDPARSTMRMRDVFDSIASPLSTSCVIDRVKMV